MLNETLIEVLQNKSCCERRLTAADLPTASRKPLDSESSREAAPAEALTCSLSDCVSTDRWTHSIVLLQSDGNTPAFTITRQTQRAALTPETRVCLFEFSDKVTEKRSDSV